MEKHELNLYPIRIAQICQIFYTRCLFFGIHIHKQMQSQKLFSYLITKNI